MARKPAGSGPKSRSAVTGRYVTEDYAKRHPKTTVEETDKKKPAKKK